LGHTIFREFLDGSLQKTIYYTGIFERQVNLGEYYPKNIHYIYGGDGLAAIYTKQYSTENMYYVHKDHLGSLDKVTNSAGAVVQSNSFEHFRTIMADDKEVGKRLDFLTQELNREANTITSKTSNMKVKENALAIKSEIEKIREQVQNIE
jgi:hypothetical protein